VPGDTEDAAQPRLRQRLLGPLRANLVWRSSALRHAVRAAVAAAPALAFTMLWYSPYDHWLTISIVASMQPYVASTYSRAFERAAGTALGGVIGAVVGLLFTTRIAMAAAMFPLAMTALAVRAVSIGLFMIALTPLVVLLVETGAPGSSEWEVAGARAAFAVIGGIIAVAANLTLWPSREPERLGGEARAAIAAYGRFAETELGYLLGDTPLSKAEARRRAAGLAGNSLEAAISRALIEPGGGKSAQLEAALVIDAALRRCGGRLSAMQHDLAMRGVPASDLRAWRDWIGNSMRRLGEGGVDLPPRPQAACEALARLARQVELMAGAANRLTP
jgi:uncharacterized membrane protein YccC